MTSVPKLDNNNPKPKLDLRRHFLRRYHADGSARVMDCCSGGGLLWHALRREFVVASYWALDTKPKRGRLAIDSSRVLAQSGWSENVIDIDTYGFPWNHYAAALASVAGPTTFFLTVGNYHLTPSGLVKQALGMGDLNVPQSLLAKLYHSAAPMLLSPKCYGRDDLRVGEAREARYLSSRYYGLRIEPTQRVQS